jgi:23S rRNA (adenine2503-C2)-methyltransferase
VTSLFSFLLPTRHALAPCLQVSKDGTVKRAYALPDGQLIESVLMPYKDGRNTACISSQAGCGMGCVFCATGQMGFARHLKSAEIFEQASALIVLLPRCTSFSL